MSVRFEMRVEGDLMAAIDKARKTETRAAFIKRWMRAVVDGEAKIEMVHDSRAVRRQPVEVKPEPDLMRALDESLSAVARPASSAQVKAGVKPIPKGGK